jgi:hypothetical protein
MPEWYETAGPWLPENRERAELYLRDQWHIVLGPNPPQTVDSRAFADARDRFVGGWRFRGGSSPEVFRDHVARHLGSLMFVLIGTSAVARAREQLERWHEAALPVPRARAELEQWLLAVTGQKRARMLLEQWLLANTPPAPARRLLERWLLKPGRTAQPRQLLELWLLAAGSQDEARLLLQKWALASARIDRARKLLERWLRNDALPRERLTSEVTYLAARAKKSSGDPGGLILMFCRTDLGSVVRNYKPERASAWDYLIDSFHNFVTRQLKLEAGKAASKEILTGSIDEAAEAGGDPDREISTKWSQTLDQRRIEEYERFKSKWASTIRTKDDHKAGLCSTCVDCRQLKILHRYYKRRKRAWEAIEFDRSVSEDDAHDTALHKELARELRITENHSRILLLRARQRVKEGLSRYPIDLVYEETRQGWRVRLNRFAIWDTPIEISCTPTDLARPEPASLTIGEGLEWASHVLTVRTTPYAASRPTAVIFSGCGMPDSIAAGEVRMNQARLAVSANGCCVDKWLDVPPTVNSSPVQLTISSSEPGTSISLAGEWFQLPAKLKISSGPTRVTFNAKTPPQAPAPGRVSLRPPRIVGGASVDATIALGVEVIAEANGGRARSVLEIKPTNKVVVAVTSSNSMFASPRGSQKRQRHGRFGATIRTRAAVFEVRIDSNKVSDNVDVEIAAQSAGRVARGILTLLPPPLGSLRFLDKSGASITELHAGSVITGRLKFASSLIRETPVELSVNHRGVTLECPSVVIAKDEQTATFNLAAAPDAKNGKARVTARANGVEVDAVIDVVGNGFKSLTFDPPSVIGGQRAQGTVVFLHPVASVVTLDVRTLDSRFAKLLPASLTVPKDASRAQFDVLTERVGGPVDVTIAVVGLGDEIVEDLALNAPKGEVV